MVILLSIISDALDLDLLTIKILANQNFIILVITHSSYIKNQDSKRSFSD